MDALKEGYTDAAICVGESRRERSAEIAYRTGENVRFSSGGDDAYISRAVLDRCDSLYRVFD